MKKKFNQIRKSTQKWNFRIQQQSDTTIPAQARNTDLYKTDTDNMSKL